ncbi:hypothetical protein SAGN_08985 [Staphylococcus agnetis]|nr:hypothetical protein SAGN_08985 [Staphylococcus agnetis]PTH71336.1 hypothetical protein BU580_11920 [Staphylococcus agnetis]
MIDLSQEALDWVKQNAINNDVKIEINKGDVTKDILVERYDFDI